MGHVLSLEMTPCAGQWLFRTGEVSGAGGPFARTAGLQLVELRAER